ncbi:MAG: putative ABC transporter permease [Eubacteriales bacterium]
MTGLNGNRILNITRRKHFSDGPNFYMLFWTFLIGSFFGVAAETLYCLIRFHQFTYTAGLLYGPFNVVYGLGALFITLGAYWLRKRNIIIILLAGMIIGALVEFGCSWMQEKIFGSVSWNYSGQPYNIFGRTSLKLSLFWGILTILWVRYFYPFMIRQIRKIPNVIAKPLTWALLLFMLLNISVSAYGVWRWSDRLHDRPARFAVDAYFDEYFPNKKMEKFYPNMKFVNK